MSHDDFAFEPVNGLPERPPAHERVLWQGRPDTWALARDAFRIRWIVGYFAVIVLWRASVGSIDSGMAGAFAFGIPYLLLGLAAFAVVLGLAWVQARATVYTITTARVAMRIGAALTVTLNLPFRQIANVDLARNKDGSGTIAFETMGETRFSYLVLWPHMRPGHFTITKPAFRCVADANAVAQIISQAADARISEPIVTRATQTAPAAQGTLPGAVVAAE